MSILQLIVNESTRKLSNRSSNQVFVVNDANVDTIRFSIPAGFSDITIDDHTSFRVMYIPPGIDKTVYAKTLTFVQNDGVYISYDWQVGPNILTSSGILTVSFCILKTGSEVQEWHTIPCTISVSNTIHTDDSDEADETITPTVAQRVAVLESMIQRVASGAPIVVASTSAMTNTNQIYVLSTNGRWYYHNGTAWVAGGTYGAVATDTTLTQSGIPADAKAVGDEITNLKDDYNGIKSALNGIYDVVRLDRITPTQTVNGYIRTNGNYYPSDAYNIIKYEVVAGTTIYISADKVNEAVYQFQDSNSIPNSSNTHIIGETVQASTHEYVTVPTDATWLLISDVVNGKNGIYNPNTDKVFEFVDNFTIEGSIPGEFNSLVEKCAVTLDELSGKKVFVSNKNLLPQFPAITDHGVTCTQNADGSITLSGTSTSTASFQLSGNVMPNVGPGTYTLSARNQSAIGDNLTYINPAINGSYSSVGCRLNTVDAETTFTLSEGQYISAIRIRIAANVALPNNYTLYPQLEVGETKTDFVAHKDYIVMPTANPTEVSCFAGYNYICVQNGVSGSLAYYFDAPNVLSELDGRVSELDGRVTALENKPSVSKKFAGKKIVCFGDSITGNFQAPTDYPSMIAELTGATVYNAGFGGCCMCDNGQTRRLFTMCRLVDSIVAGDFTAQRNSGVSITYGGTSIDYVPERLTMLEGINWSEIDYITIAYGTNDWNSNYPLDNENNLLDTASYIGAFRYSVETLLAKYPNIKIMAITPLWRWWDTNTGMPSEIHSDYIDSNDYAKGTGYKLWQYGDTLVEASKMYHIPVFDLYWNCMMFKQNRFQYFNTTDGTHPKQEGRELMAELISAHMESVY